MLSLRTPEYVVRNTVSAISSAMEKIAFLNSSKANGSRVSVKRKVRRVAAVARRGGASHVTPAGGSWQERRPYNENMKPCEAKHDFGPRADWCTRVRDRH